MVTMEAPFGTSAWWLLNPRPGISYRSYLTPVWGWIKSLSSLSGTPAWESSVSKLKHYFDNVTMEVPFRTCLMSFNFFVLSSVK